MAAYGEAEYWDRRYAAEPSWFDWYLLWQHLEPILSPHIPRDASILQLGVGMSLLQANMVQQGGYQSILSIDISSVAIKHLQEAHGHIPQLKYRVADARSLPQFKDGSFDAILDKGTLDSLMCGQHAGEDSMRMLQEAHRLLREGGCFLLCSYGEPSARVPLLHGQQFEVTFYMLTKSQQLVAGSAVGGAPVDGKWSVAMQGPLDPHTQQLDAFQHSNSTYYVYVCKKAGPGGAAAAAAAAPS